MRNYEEENVMPINKDKLLPCPFCREQPTYCSYDRGIHIGCKTCGYTRYFPGLLQSVPDHNNQAGGITPIPGRSNGKEYYHMSAYEKATEAWNRRLQDE